MRSWPRSVIAIFSPSKKASIIESLMIKASFRENSTAKRLTVPPLRSSKSFPNVPPEIFAIPPCWTSKKFPNVPPVDRQTAARYGSVRAKFSPKSVLTGVKTAVFLLRTLSESF